MSARPGYRISRIDALPIRDDTTPGPAGITPLKKGDSDARASDHVPGTTASGSHAQQRNRGKQGRRRAGEQGTGGPAEETLTTAAAPVARDRTSGDLSSARLSRAQGQRSAGSRHHGRLRKHQWEASDGRASTKVAQDNLSSRQQQQQQQNRNIVLRERAMGPGTAPPADGRTEGKVGSPPRSPRNALHRPDVTRERRPGNRPFHETQGAGRHASRALRGVIGTSSRLDRRPFLAGGDSTRPVRAPVADAQDAYDISSREQRCPRPGESPHEGGDRHASKAGEGDGRRQDSRTAAKEVRARHSSREVPRYRIEARSDVDAHDRNSVHATPLPPPQHAEGTCTNMCPPDEMHMRQVEGCLSAFEATDATAGLPFRDRIADPNKAVKKYRRSAAGRNMHRPDQLRPLGVLQATAKYLVQEVFAKASVEGTVAHHSARAEALGANPWPKGKEPNASGAEKIPATARAYIFVEDRLRAVRQDLTVQGLALASGAAEVLKIAANFYIAAGYLLCDEPPEVFDKHLNARELQGVLCSLADLFFEAVHALATTVHTNSQGDMQLDVAGRGQGVSRVFSTTVSKLCDWPIAGERAAPTETEGVTCASQRRSSNTPGIFSFGRVFPKMALATRLYRAVSVGNWTDFNRLLGRRPRDPNVAERVADEAVESPFAIRLRCVCHSMLLPLRAHALRVLNVSLTKSERVPLGDIRRSLGMRDDAQAADLCQALSLPVDDGVATFKSVPAKWTTETTRTHPPPPRREGEPTTHKDTSCQGTREDDWVGVSRAIRGASSVLEQTCIACGGFGCTWCDGGVVREGEEEGLWETVLRAPCGF